jgi:light-regulated signal transduction histidine kinase (bacteriophytochrome)
MHKALVADITKQEEQEAILRKRYEELEKLHQQIQDDEQVKANFLHNVTNRMIAPAKSIDNSAKSLCDHYGDITLTEANKLKDNIQLQSETIIDVLDHHFNVSSNKAGKENNHG